MGKFPRRTLQLVTKAPDQSNQKKVAEGLPQVGAWRSGGPSLVKYRVDPSCRLLGGIYLGRIHSGVCSGVLLVLLESRGYIQIQVLGEVVEGDSIVD